MNEGEAGRVGQGDEEGGMRGENGEMRIVGE